jgi:hypothetical protein
VTCQSDAHACSEEPRGTDLARNASAHVHRQITSAIRFAFLAVLSTNVVDSEAI